MRPAPATRRPVRPAIRLARLIRAACAAAGLAAATALSPLPVLAQSADPDIRRVEMTPTSARDLALAMLAEGRPDVAAQIADQLIAADPGDAFAHLLLARALADAGRPDEARRAAARAFRRSDTGHEKFRSAQFAAQMAVQQERFTAAQIWLRRALPHVPDPRFREVVEADYRRVRALNPLNLRFDLSVTPTSNANNGADSPFVVIDGIPVIGLLSGDALALPGTVASFDAKLSWRLAGSAAGRTDMTARLYTRQVIFTDEARRKAPGVRGRDYSSVTAEVGMIRRQKLGESLLSFGVTLGRTWQGGEPRQDDVAVSLGWGRSLGPATELALTAEREWRDNLLFRSGDQDITSLTAQLGRDLGGAGSLGVALNWRGSDSPSTNGRSERWTAYASWQPAQAVGPAELTLYLGAARETFPDYRVGFFAVPGGREDESVFATADLLFTGLDHAGFAPALTIQGRRTRSNVSRFETEELSVSLGLRSSF